RSGTMGTAFEKFDEEGRHLSVDAFNIRLACWELGKFIQRAFADWYEDEYGDNDLDESDDNLECQMMDIILESFLWTTHPDYMERNREWFNAQQQEPD